MKDTYSMSDQQDPHQASFAEYAGETPMVQLREPVIFPYSLTPLTIEADDTFNIAAVEKAMENDRALAIFPEIPPDKELNTLPMQTTFQIFQYNSKRFSAIGALARVIKQLKFPDGSYHLLLRGLKRVTFSSLNAALPVPMVRFSPLIDPVAPAERKQNDGRISALQGMFRELVQVHPNLPDELGVAALNAENGTRLADLIADAMPFHYPEKLMMLSRRSEKERLDNVIILINRELETVKLGLKIQTEVNSAVGQSQRDFYLREQMHAIQRELKEDARTPDVINLSEKLDKAKLPENVEKVARRELDRLEMIPTSAPEYHIAFAYINWLLDVPWGNFSEDCLDCKIAAEVLDADHYALRDVKDRILDFLAVLQLRGQEKLKSPILCLVGPPGVGKTSLGKSIARAMNRKFIRMSLGGVRDEAEIRGHRRTYVGAMPGRILQNLKKAGTSNPVFMLDEIDKLSHDFRGDPASALLEVLDPAQNNAFNDNYLELDYDLSKVFFIATANVEDSIPAPLRDRMEIVRLAGYTVLEKREIAKRYLVPRQIENAGLAEYNVKIMPSAIAEIIDYYTREAGVRELERSIERLCRKIAREITSGKEPEKQISAASVRRLLGVRKFLRDEAPLHPGVGCATGLAWTSCGGVVLPIETLAMPGKGELKLTGSLGKVMQESAETAYSLIRSRSASLNVPEDFFAKHDFHIHVPDGATPKDGPSAGITLSLALYSLLTGKPMRSKLAMTGEITLSGRVSAIGGLREKVIAALRAGMDTVMLPKENAKDIEEIPDEVKSKLNLVCISSLDDALKIAYPEKSPAPKKTVRKRK